jgi:hypothetical protein
MCHGNTKSQRTFSVDDFGGRADHVMDHPAISPDLAPCDVFMLFITKKHLSGSHFQTVQQIQNITGAP